MQSNCLELAERRRDEGTRLQSSCSEHEEEDEEFRKQGCRAVA